jgi:Fe-Mn family superoxide dismutase
MFILPDLPYPKNALEPVLSEVLMTTHHDKHHATYVNNLNKMMADAGKTPASLEDVVRESAADPAQKKVFNNAAQAWNHGFFWECMTPAYAAPSGELAAAIDKAFGSLEAFKARFVEEGATHFASGWAWLVAKGGELSVISTHDAGCPITVAGVTPLIVCDVWEHAYYLDYQQDRKGVLEKWFDTVANWSLAAAQYDAAQRGVFGWRYPPRAE